MATPSIQRVTVAADGSPIAEEAVGFAIDLAKKYGAELTILAVSPLVPLYVASSEPWVPVATPDIQTPYYRKALNAAVEQATTAGVQATGICVEGVVVDEILAQLEANPPDLFVIGSRGLSRGKRLLLGSVSTAIVHAAKCPVLVVRPRSTTPSS